MIDSDILQEQLLDVYGSKKEQEDVDKQIRRYERNGSHPSIPRYILGEDKPYPYTGIFYGIKTTRPQLSLDISIREDKNDPALSSLALMLFEETGQFRRGLQFTKTLEEKTEKSFQDERRVYSSIMKNLTSINGHNKLPREDVDYLHSDRAKKNLVESERLSLR